MAPTLLPVSVASFKLHAHIDADGQDTAIDEYLAAAADWVEKYQNRCWRSSTWQASYDCFPDCGVFYIPRPPLVSATIQYVDTAGVTQTLDSSVYVVDTISEPGRISLAYGQSWPDTLDQNGAVTVTFVAGYSSAAEVPAVVRQAIRLVAAASFEQREGVSDDKPVEVPMSVYDLLAQDRLLSYR